METSSSIFNFFDSLSEESETDTNETANPETELNPPPAVNFVEEDSSRLNLQFSNEQPESKCSDDNVEIILSVYWKRGKLGAAYYTCFDSQV